MTHRTDSLLRFVRAVRRRMILLRLVERVGLAVAAGSAVGLVLAAVLIYRGQGAGELLAALLGLAGLAGIIWGLSNRPTILAAAQEADQQLDLADLFSTALSLGPDAFDQEFAGTVRDLAAGRAAVLSPSALVLRKLTGRAWSGIGLTTALALAAALLSARPSLIQAQDDSSVTSPFVSPNQLSSKERPNSSSASWPVAIRPPRPQDNSSGSDTDRTGDDPKSDATTRSGHAGSGRSTSSDGQGGGMANTADSGHQPAPAAPDATGANTSDPNGQRAGGTGRSAEGAAGADPGSTSTSGNSSGRPTPPWRSNNWEAVRAQAIHETDQSPIPDNYRELIRDYFSER